jgi:hypothetical protein
MLLSPERPRSTFHKYQKQRELYTAARFVRSNDAWRPSSVSSFLFFKLQLLLAENPVSFRDRAENVIE